jgi:hypothetical protein
MKMTVLWNVAAYSLVEVYQTTWCNIPEYSDLFMFPTDKEENCCHTFQFLNYLSDSDEIL